MARRTKTAVWGVLAAVGFIVLAWLPPTSGISHKAKARAQRIATVNSVRSVSFTLTNTSAQPGTRPATSN
jgi:hypothetical protein